MKKNEPVILDAYYCLDGVWRVPNEDLKSEYHYKYEPFTAFGNGTYASWPAGFSEEMYKAMIREIIKGLEL